MARTAGRTERHLILAPASRHILLPSESRHERRRVQRAPVHRTRTPGMVRQHMGQDNIPRRSHRNGGTIPASPQTQGEGTPHSTAAHTRRRDERGEAEVLHEHQSRDTHAAHTHRLAAALPHQGRQRPTTAGHLRPYAKKRRTHTPPHQPDDGPEENRQGNDGHAHGRDGHGDLRRRRIQPLHAAGQKP